MKIEWFCARCKGISRITDNTDTLGTEQKCSVDNYVLNTMYWCIVCPWNGVDRVLDHARTCGLVANITPNYEESYSATPRKSTSNSSIIQAIRNLASAGVSSQEVIEKLGVSMARAPARLPKEYSITTHGHKEHISCIACPAHTTVVENPVKKKFPFMVVFLNILFIVWKFPHALFSAKSASQVDYYAWRIKIALEFYRVKTVQQVQELPTETVQLLPDQNRLYDDPENTTIPRRGELTKSVVPKINSWEVVKLKRCMSCLWEGHDKTVANCPECNGLLCFPVNSLMVPNRYSLCDKCGWTKKWEYNDDISLLECPKCKSYVSDHNTRKVTFHHYHLGYVSYPHPQDEFFCVELIDTATQLNFNDIDPNKVPPPGRSNLIRR